MNSANLIAQRSKTIDRLKQSVNDNQEIFSRLEKILSRPFFIRFGLSLLSRCQETLPQQHCCVVVAVRSRHRMADACENPPIAFFVIVVHFPPF
jgi:hypothetical protein